MNIFFKNIFFIIGFNIFFFSSFPHNQLELHYFVEEENTTKKLTLKEVIIPLDQVIKIFIEFYKHNKIYITCEELIKFICEQGTNKIESAEEINLMIKRLLQYNADQIYDCFTNCSSSKDDKDIFRPIVYEHFSKINKNDFIEAFNTKLSAAYLMHSVLGNEYPYPYKLHKDPKAKLIDIMKTMSCFIKNNSEKIEVFLIKDKKKSKALAQKLISKALEFFDKYQKIQCSGVTSFVSFLKELNTVYKELFFHIFPTNNSSRTSILAVFDYAKNMANSFEI